VVEDKEEKPAAEERALVPGVASS